MVLSILVGALVLGQISAFAPDYVKAKVAAARLFKIFDRESLIEFLRGWIKTGKSVFLLSFSVNVSTLAQIIIHRHMK